MQRYKRRGNERCFFETAVRTIVAFACATLIAYWLGGEFVKAIDKELAIQQAQVEQVPLSTRQLTRK